MESCFKTLCPKSEEYPRIILQIKQILIPLYGKQPMEQALEKVRLGQDRICEIFYETDIPRGLIIFKNFLNNEYKVIGIVNGYEQKTTLPMIPEDGAKRRFSARREVMYKLLNRGANNAIAMSAECFFGTVSSEKSGTLRLLIDLGFEVRETFKDKFKIGVNECLLVHKDLDRLKELTSIY